MKHLLPLLLLITFRLSAQTKSDSTPLSSMQYVRFVIPGDTSRILCYTNGHIAVKGDTMAIIKYLLMEMIRAQSGMKAANKELDYRDERRKKLKQ